MIENVELFCIVLFFYNNKRNNFNANLKKEKDTFKKINLLFSKFTTLSMELLANADGVGHVIEVSRKKVQQSPVEKLNVNTTRQVIGRGNLLNTGF